MHLTFVSARLRCLRQVRGLSMKAAADAAGLNTSTVYRIEHGLVAPRESTLRILMGLYGEAAHEGQVLSLLRCEREPGWFDAPQVPLWLAGYLALEDQAQVIYTYGPQYIPALLQTRAYAEAASRASRHPGATPEQVNGGADLIMRRQELLDSCGAPHLWAVLDRKAVTDPPLTDADDRVEQVDALVSASKQPNIAVQIARPSADTGYLYHGAPFTLLRFPERERPDMLVLHLMHGPVLVEDRQQAEDYQQAFARLSLSSFRVDDTFEVLNGVRATLSG
jgi:transcriptional regulator with XRE-family HTH domain